MTYCDYRYTVTVYAIVMFDQASKSNLIMNFALDLEFDTLHLHCYTSTNVQSESR